jgi:hypothetical protein
MPSERELLKEYVRTLLSEEGDHGGYGAYDLISTGMSMSPYGVHYGSGNDLYNIFIKPFADVVNTTIGKTKELSVKAQTLVRTAFETIATTIIPILRDDYKQIFDQERHALQKIKQEYSEVYKSNWDAFLDNDVLVAAFFYAPAAFFTIGFARKAPDALLGMLSTLTGGRTDDVVHRIKNRHNQGHDQHRSHGHVGGFGRANYHHKKGELGPIGAGIDYYEGVVREASEGGSEGADLAKLFSSKKLHAMIEDNQLVKQMESQGRAAVQASLKDVLDRAKAVMSARTLQDLQSKTKAKLQGLDKLQQVPQQDRQKFEQAILKSTKESMKSFYLKNLEAQVKQATDGGVPTSSPYVQAYHDTIGKIKAM